MLRRHGAALRLALMTADAFSAMLLFIAISILRYGESDWGASWALAGMDGNVLAIAYGYGWIAVLWLLGLYRMRARWSLRSEALDIVRAALLLAVATFAVLFWFKMPNVSRQFLLMIFPAQVALTLASRFALRGLFGAARARGYNVRHMLVVGSGASAVEFARWLRRHRDLGVVVIGHLAGPGSNRGSNKRLATGTILGEIDDIEEVLHSHVVDEVAICLPRGEWHLVEPITRLCEDEGKIVRIPLDGIGLTLPGGRIEDFDDVQILSLVYGPDRVVSLLAKRALDIGLAAAALLVLAPIFAVVAGWILVTDGRPVVFSQTRVGLHGRPFTIYKFRTMVKDAEDRYDEVVALSDTKGPAFKMKDDPRITPIGRFLRKTSIDELPQVWNVLRGEMSIVGPRPAPPREVQGYDVWHRRRLSMKPGITGLWQVEARFDEEFDNRARLDLAYIDRWSLMLDLKIIARTIPALMVNPGH
jgi:exopolysaccharide biosynthesis polyprenyl glycosylphosphotransferase